MKYEAYDNEMGFNLFNDSFYISDSEWTRWKCYKNGKLQLNDNRKPEEYFREKTSKNILIDPSRNFLQEAHI